MPVNLTEDLDIFVWKLNISGTFSVKSMYADIMNGYMFSCANTLERLKVLLKIKIFMWFLYKKVILIKDNLAKRKLNDCKKCVFCDSEESINYLFFTCPFARLIWRTVQFTFNIPPPANVTNMFGNWLNGVEKKSKAQIRTGICALMWAIWNCRNDLVFNKCRNAHFLQVIQMVTH
jgi:hypothetical protein